MPWVCWNYLRFSVDTFCVLMDLISYVSGLFCGNMGFALYVVLVYFSAASLV